MLLILRLTWSDRIASSRQKKVDDCPWWSTNSLSAFSGSSLRSFCRRWCWDKINLRNVCSQLITNSCRRTPSFWNHYLLKEYAHRGHLHKRTLDISTYLVSSHDVPMYDVQNTHTTQYLNTHIASVHNIYANITPYTHTHSTSARTLHQHAKSRCTSLDAGVHVLHTRTSLHTTYAVRDTAAHKAGTYA